MDTNIHEEPKTDKEIEEKRALLFEQRKGLVGQPIVWITCICGGRLALRMAFRCWCCGFTFCSQCAEQHFGKKPLIYQAPAPEAQAVEDAKGALERS